jgi:DNA-binding NtrC family response regulator
MSDALDFSDFKVLIVEDDDLVRVPLEDRLEREGIPAQGVADAARARGALASGIFDLMITDVRLPDGSGKDLFEHASRSHPGLPIILMTAFGSVSDAVALVRGGALDYVEKPFDLDALIERVKGVLSNLAYIRSETAQMDERFRLGEGVLGRAAAIRRIERLLGRLHSVDSPVVIVAESGLGKKVLARMIHQSSHRADKPFVKLGVSHGINVLAELSGKEGAIARSAIGTLYLDDLAGLPDAAQLLLLSHIRDPVTRSGEKLASSPRLIVATRDPPERLVEEGKLRRDLFWKIDVIRIQIPPLRERPQDIVFLARRLLQEMARAKSRSIAGLSPDAEARLSELPLPGNVRELRNILARAMVLCDGARIECHDLDLDLSGSSLDDVSARGEAKLKDAVEEAEQTAIRAALIQQDWIISKAADVLGISRKNLWEKMRRYGISR